MTTTNQQFPANPQPSSAQGEGRWTLRELLEKFRQAAIEGENDELEAACGIVISWVPNTILDTERVPASALQAVEQRLAEVERAEKDAAADAELYRGKWEDARAGRDQIRDLNRWLIKQNKDAREQLKAMREAITEFVAAVDGSVAKGSWSPPIRAALDELRSLTTPESEDEKGSDG